MKRADSTYPVQRPAATEKFRGWCKHRFLAEQRGTNRDSDRLRPGKSCAGYPARNCVGVTLVTARKARVKALWS